MKLKRYALLLLKKQNIALLVTALFLTVSVVAFKNIFFIALLLMAAAFSKLPEIAFRSINTDMTFFVLLILSQAYGIPFGLFVALLTFYVALAVKTLVTKHIAPENIIVPPIGYLVVALLILPLGYSFTTVMIALAVYATIMIIAYGAIYGFQLFDTIIYVLTIFAFNYFLFTNMAPFALSVLKV